MLGTSCVNCEELPLVVDDVVINVLGIALPRPVSDAPGLAVPVPHCAFVIKLANCVAASLRPSSNSTILTHHLCF